MAHHPAQLPSPYQESSFSTKEPLSKVHVSEMYTFVMLVPFHAFPSLPSMHAHAVYGWRNGSHWEMFV